MRKWGEEERRKKVAARSFQSIDTFVQKRPKNKMKQKKPPVKENLKVRYERIIFDLFLNISLK